MLDNSAESFTFASNAQPIRSLAWPSAALHMYHIYVQVLKAQGRKLTAEATDNGLLAPELAAGISRVKSAKTQGIRVANWLSLRQAQLLLSAPDITTLRGFATVPSWPCS